ncbi:protein kinase [Cavenderia fasciculata]|uniref:Protein kinase n=1 Tax=Cavenderia fasciculata TaxID=261658 RepID=F4PY93_CACFS|nr:protein kinase [Cavenderia fasciculata]EGG19360.1 protein kinase [Cavenderia fasciculata]|eukprot:XP_004357631.1 protein kinase [Cavenderia fasciculata]
MIISNNQQVSSEISSNSSSNTTNSPTTSSILPLTTITSPSSLESIATTTTTSTDPSYNSTNSMNIHTSISPPINIISDQSTTTMMMMQLTPDQLQQATLEQILSSTPSSSSFKLGVHRHRYNGSNNSNGSHSSSSTTATTAPGGGSSHGTPTTTTSTTPATTNNGFQLFPQHNHRISAISTVSNTSKRMSSYSGGGGSNIETDVEQHVYSMVGSDLHENLGDDENDNRDDDDDDNSVGEGGDTAIHDQPSFNELTITCDTLTETDEDDDLVQFIQDDDGTETETESETDTEIELTNKNKNNRLLKLLIQQQEKQILEQQLQEQQQQQQLQQTQQIQHLSTLEEDDTDGDEADKEDGDDDDDDTTIEDTDDELVDDVQQQLSVINLARERIIMQDDDDENTLITTTPTISTTTCTTSSMSTMSNSITTIVETDEPIQLPTLKQNHLLRPPLHGQSLNNSTDDINEEEFLIFQNQFLYDMSHNTSSSVQEVTQQTQQLIEFRQNQQQRRIERERLIRIEEQDKRIELMRIEHELHMTRRREQEERKHQVQLAHIHQLQELHHSGSSSSSKRHSKLSSSTIFNSKAVKSTPVLMQTSSTHKKTKSSTHSIPSALLSKHVSSPTNMVPSPSSSKIFDQPPLQQSHMSSPRGGVYDLKNVAGSVDSISSLSSYHSASSSVRSSPLFLASPLVSPRYENQSLASSTSSMIDPTSSNHMMMMAASSSIDSGYPISPTSAASTTKNHLSFSSSSISPPPDHHESNNHNHNQNNNNHHNNNHHNNNNSHPNSHHRGHHHSHSKDNSSGGGKKSQFFTNLFNVKKLSQNLKEGRDRDRDKDSYGSNSSRGSNNSKDNEECYVQIYRGNGESWRAKVNRSTTVRDVFGMVRGTSNQTDNEYELYISKPHDNTPACLSDSGQFFQPPQIQQSPSAISSSLGSNSLANSGGIKQTNRQLHEDEKLLKAQRKWTGPSIFILKTISKPRTSVCSNFSESSDHNIYYTPKSTFNDNPSPIPSPWSSPLSPPSNMSYVNGVGGVESIPSFNLDSHLPMTTTTVNSSELSTSPPPVSASTSSAFANGYVPTSQSFSSALNGDWKVGERPKGIVQWINPDELELIKKVGAGSFAKVYKGKYMGETVAIKVLKDNSPEQLENFKKEYDSLSMVSSPQLIRFYGACKEKKLKMVMEYCRFGSLNNIMNKKRFELSWPLVLKWMLQAFHGVNCLHNTGLVHRDIKSHNLLINSNFDLKVADLGLTKPADIQTNGNLKGTMAYCAPELYSGEQYKPSCDIYSMGVVLWEIVNRCIMGKYQRPFSDNPEISFDFQIIILTSKQRIRPTMPPSVPPKLEQLIRSCWDQDASKRPDGNQVIEVLEKLCSEYMANKQEWDEIIPQHQQAISTATTTITTTAPTTTTTNIPDHIEIIPN